jgi:hypothetical protein
VGEFLADLLVIFEVLPPEVSDESPPGLLSGYFGRRRSSAVY